MHFLRHGTVHQVLLTAFNDTMDKMLNK